MVGVVVRFAVPAGMSLAGRPHGMMNAGVCVRVPAIHDMASLAMVLISTVTTSVFPYEQMYNSPWNVRALYGSLIWYAVASMGPGPL